MLSQTSYSQNKQKKKKNERGHTKTLSHGHRPVNVKGYLHLPGHLAQHALGGSVGCPARQERHLFKFQQLPVSMNDVHNSFLKHQRTFRQKWISVLSLYRIFVFEKFELERDVFITFCNGKKMHVYKEKQWKCKAVECKKAL